MSFWCHSPLLWREHHVKHHWWPTEVQPQTNLVQIICWKHSLFLLILQEGRDFLGRDAVDILTVNQRQSNTFSKNNRERISTYHLSQHLFHSLSHWVNSFQDKLHCDSSYHPHSVVVAGPSINMESAWCHRVCWMYWRLNSPQATGTASDRLPC